MLARPPCNGPNTDIHLLVSTEVEEKVHTQVWSEHQKPQMLYSSPVWDVSTHLTLCVLYTLTTETTTRTPNASFSSVALLPVVPVVRTGPSASLSSPDPGQDVKLKSGIAKCCLANWGLAPKKDKICWWHGTPTWIKPTKAILIRWKNQVRCLWGVVRGISQESMCEHIDQKSKKCDLFQTTSTSTPWWLDRCVRDCNSSFAPQHLSRLKPAL